jgi:DUF4097 and DUF4098 domain-containing protein YvlB
MTQIKGFITQAAISAFVVLSVAGCIVIDGEGWSGQAKSERTVELLHPMSSGSALAVSTASGSIDVTGQETDQVRVVATIQARAATEQEAQELAEQVEISFQEAGGKLVVKADRPDNLHWKRSISISYVITVPRQTHVDCDSASGSLKLRDLTGNVNAHTASGSVEGAQIKGFVRLRSSSGSIHCENVGSGDVDLDTASGGVRLSDASDVGTCRAHSSSGSVRVQHVQADVIRMDSGSGGVTAEDVTCAHLNGRSGSGHVSVAFAPSAPNNVAVDLGTGSGGISVTMPPAFAGRVDLSVASGSVHIEQPVTVQGDIGKRHVTGTIGEGTGSLSAHTGSGSIDVR